MSELEAMVEETEEGGSGQSRGTAEDFASPFAFLVIRPLYLQSLLLSH